MKFIPIPPINNQFDFTRPMFFGLIHLFKHEAYRSYVEKVALKVYSILDNSAYEVGTSNIFQLIEVALKYHFAEVIFPDVLRDDVNTIKLTRTALRDVFHNFDKAYQSDLRFMLVPQGKSAIQWAVCLEILIEEHERLFPNRPFTIGVPKVTARFPGGRLRLITEYVLPLQEKFKFHIHMLGMAEHLDELYLIRNRLGEHVRSIDSARPFIWAMNQIGISPMYAPLKYPGRPEGYFEHTLSPKEFFLAEQNVYAYEWIFNGASN